MLPFSCRIPVGDADTDFLNGTFIPPGSCLACQQAYITGAAWVIHTHPRERMCIRDRCTDSLRTKLSDEHADATPTISRICGPVEKVNDTTFKAVSYTHLYASSLTRNIVRLRAEGLRTCSSRTSPTTERTPNCPSSVSYTHLDVYKRQPYTRPCLLLHG